MKGHSSRDTCKRLLNVSRETMLGFDIYLNFFQNGNKNLIW